MHITNIITIWSGYAEPVSSYHGQQTLHSVHLELCLCQPNKYVKEKSNIRHIY